MKPFTISSSGGQWGQGWIQGGPFDDSLGRISIPTQGRWGPRTPMASVNGGTTGDFHHGLDFDGPDLCNLLSLIEGDRVDLGWDPAQVGHYVAIRSNTVDQQKRLWTVIYGHMPEESPVPMGAHVTEGTVLGRQDTTGLATGTHLHLGIVIDDFNQDPMLALLPFSADHTIEAPAVNATPADRWHDLAVNAESIRTLLEAGAPQQAVDARVELAKQQWAGLP